MIQVIFSIKFQSQLRRTRPAIFESLEKTIITSAQLSGGITRRAFHCLVADFDETAMGFWIDVISCIESVNRAVHRTANELYGFVCVICKFVDDDTIPYMMQALPSDGKASGIWCTDSVRRSLNYFAGFGENRREVPVNSDLYMFTEIETIKETAGKTEESSLYKKVYTILSQRAYKSAVLLGKDFIGKRQTLQRFCRSQSTYCKPLVIRFKYTGSDLSCLPEALTPEIRTLLEQCSLTPDEEMGFLYQAISRERLRKENSKYVLQQGRRFFNLLLTAYCNACTILKQNPVLIFENIQYAREDVSDVILAACAIKERDHTLAYFGTCSLESVPKPFARLLPFAINCHSEIQPVFNPGNISVSLWETAYACMLFSRYFPSWSCITLFEEQGKNRQAVHRAFELLLQNNIIISPDNPEIALPEFAEKAALLLGERCAYIQSLVKTALLNHLGRGQLASCYNFLEAIYELGGGISDDLALEAIRADVINGTYCAIEKALTNGSFYDVAGQERANALRYCYKTLKALLFASEAEIKQVFRTLPQEESNIKIYKSQILTIEASYKMGLHDTDAALNAIKESMMISQTVRGKSTIAHVYRLFSLVNLSKKELSDALDYLSFAIDDAEKNKDLQELAISAYYAANAHFIYGNLSKAERHIKQAEQTARTAGRPEWAQRSQFVLGRLYFETGMYKSALSIFKSIYEKPIDGMPESFTTTLLAWIFRTELYFHQCKPESPPILNADGRLFELEATYLAGEYQKTTAFAENFLQELPEEGFLFLEQPDWESGFSQCELLEFSRKEFYLRMCTVWRALALSKLQSQETGDAILSMSKIMRDERFSDYDPNAPFYFFANYRILHEACSSEVDRNTAISMAFKRLQRRAGRIDDIETRRSFLTSQYWNKTLFNTAKEYKLI